MEEVVQKRSNKKRWIVVGIVGALFLLYMVFGIIDTYKEQKSLGEDVSSSDTDSEGTGYPSGDSALMRMQKSLTNKFGVAPENYIWNTDGTLLSIGDKSMSAEDVVYAYFNGLSSLDFSTVQRFSRDSVVVEKYSGYFDSKNKNTDYRDNFMRNMYRESLLSIQPNGIVNTTVFAENKEVFTVKVSMLDLTSKDFWLKDKEDIYRNLKIYRSDQSDSTKAEMYLYDYISRYYSSDEAERREVTFDITVQKYPDLDTGWLISIDTDVDLACRYADGNLVVNYILDMYNTEGREFLESISNSDKG